MVFKKTNINNIFIMLFLIVCIGCDIKNKETFLVSGGSEKFDECYGIAIDNESNIIITGTFSETIKFKDQIFNTNLKSKGSLDFFVAKYKSNGKLIWAKSFGGPKKDESANICVDEFNNMYITGYYNDTPNFLLNEYATESKSFLLKLNSDGNVIWAKKLDGENKSEGTAVCYKNHCVYWTSFFDGSMLENLNSKGMFDIACTKVTIDGIKLQQKAFGGFGNDQSRDIYYSQNNKVYITGVYDKNDSISLASVIELDTNLNKLSQEYIFDSNLSEAISIIVDNNNNKYVTGNVFVSENNYDAFLCKLTFDNKIEWKNTFSSSKTEWAKALEFDSDNNIISGVVLNANAKLYPSGLKIKGRGNYDIFISKLNKDGQILQHAIFGNSEEDGMNKMILDKKNNLIFCGWFGKTLNINGKTVKDDGDGDAFLCKEKLDSIFK
jgi:hypothetical protein